MMRPDQEQTCSAWLDQDHSWSAQILADTDRHTYIHTGLANIIVVGCKIYSIKLVQIIYLYLYLYYGH